MNTKEIMDLALKMAKMNEVPADSAIHLEGDNIRKVLFALDVSVQELLLAKDLDCDLVIAHHPIGRSIVNFPSVVRRHYDFMVESGVPHEVAERATNELLEKIKIKVHATNYEQVISAAKVMKIPLMNIHLPIDQITRDYLLDFIKSSNVKRIGELIQSLESIREFSEAATRIDLAIGNKDNPIGKWVLVFAAGTNGGYPVAKAYFDNGIDTVIYLHIDPEDLLKIRKDCKGNLIVLGHVAGDSIGINMFISELTKHGLEVSKIGVL